MKRNHRKKVVVMGGGTGIFPVISALKQMEVHITSVVAVSDSGGSTGRIRDEFGFQPVGDLRQSLAALAENEVGDWITKVLLYRFNKGTGLVGHNLGNLILTALQDMTGDTTQALEIAEKMFRLKGRVVPVTRDNVNLEIHYNDGSKEIGEHVLDENKTQPKQIAKVNLVPHAQLNPVAKKALLQADLIIIGPGDYYASLMATLVPEGIKEAFTKTKAKVMYISNLMTRVTQTDGMTASDHVQGIEKALGRKLDYILLNDEMIPTATLKLYEAEKEYPVVDDMDGDTRVIRQPLLSPSVVVKNVTDIAHRSLLRHDGNKLREVLPRIVGPSEPETEPA